jgi:hypothetical protein
MRNKFCLVVLLGGALGYAGITSAQGEQGPSGETSKHNEDIVLGRLKNVARLSKIPIRLYYGTTCNPTKQQIATNAVPFPSTNVRSSGDGKTGITAVREIFKHANNVRIAQEPSGMVRIWIGDAPTAILQTRISRIVLDPYEQYTPNGVFEAIQNTREMQSAMRSLKYSPVWVLSSTRAMPDENLPHVPASMANLTVEQVLDQVAETWAGQGIVIYGVCNQRTRAEKAKLFFFDYAGDVLPK